MKKSLYYIALSALIFSGCNSLEIDKASTGIIKIGKVSVISSATKSGDGDFNTVFSSGEETIEENATPLSSYATKAVEKKSGDLHQFNILGYYDSHIKETVEGAKINDLYFLKNTTVEKTGSTWSLNSDAKWAHDIDHYFWAYSGAASEFEAKSDDLSTASFSYNSDGSDDLLVAYTMQHWNGPDYHSDSCGSSDDIEKIEFKHALAELVANTSGYKFYLEKNVDGVTTKVDGSDRLEIEDVAFYVASKGTCEVKDASSFSWKTDSESVASISLLNEENNAFVIPQGKEGVMVQVTIHDTWRGNRWPAIYEFSGGDESKSLGAWEPGTRYTYNINGSMTVPYIEKQPISGGIELNVSGNGFGDAVTGVIQGKYIKTLELSWVGLPHTNGKGTYLAIYVGNNPPSSLGETDYNKEGIAFFYDAKDKKVVQSPNMVSYTLPSDINNHDNKDEAYLSKASCSCVISLPSEDCKVYVLYKGSDNGGTGIALKEFNCEVGSFR